MHRDTPGIDFGLFLQNIYGPAGRQHGMEQEDTTNPSRWTVDVIATYRRAPNRCCLGAAAVAGTAPIEGQTSIATPGEPSNVGRLAGLTSAMDLHDRWHLLAGPGERRQGIHGIDALWFAAGYRARVTQGANFHAIMFGLAQPLDIKRSLHRPRRLPRGQTRSRVLPAHRNNTRPCAQANHETSPQGRWQVHEPTVAAILRALS